MDSVFPQMLYNWTNLVKTWTLQPSVVEAGPDLGTTYKAWKCLLNHLFWPYSEIR